MVFSTCDWHWRFEFCPGELKKRHRRRAGLVPMLFSFLFKGEKSKKPKLLNSIEKMLMKAQQMICSTSPPGGNLFTVGRRHQVGFSALGLQLPVAECFVCNESKFESRNALMGFPMPGTQFPVAHMLCFPMNQRWRKWALRRLGHKSEGQANAAAGSRYNLENTFETHKNPSEETSVREKYNVSNSNDVYYDSSVQIAFDMTSNDSMVLRSFFEGCNCSAFSTCRVIFLRSVCH